MALSYRFKPSFACFQKQKGLPSLPCMAMHHLSPSPHSLSPPLTAATPTPTLSPSLPLSFNPFNPTPLPHSPSLSHSHLRPHPKVEPPPPTIVEGVLQTKGAHGGVEAGGKRVVITVIIEIQSLLYICDIVILQCILQAKGTYGGVEAGGMGRVVIVTIWINRVIGRLNTTFTPHPQPTPSTPHLHPPPHHTPPPPLPNNTHRTPPPTPYPLPGLPRVPAGSPDTVSPDPRSVP